MAYWHWSVEESGKKKCFEYAVHIASGFIHSSRVNVAAAPSVPGPNTGDIIVHRWSPYNIPLCYKKIAPMLGRANVAVSCCSRYSTNVIARCKSISMPLNLLKISQCPLLAWLSTCAPDKDRCAMHTRQAFHWWSSSKVMLDEEADGTIHELAIGPYQMPYLSVTTNTQQRWKEKSWIGMTYMLATAVNAVSWCFFCCCVRTIYL